MNHTFRTIYLAVDDLRRAEAVSQKHGVSVTTVLRAFIVMGLDAYDRGEGVFASLKEAPQPSDETVAEAA